MVLLSHAESGGCVRRTDTISRPPAWPLPRTCTFQLHGDRQWQGPGGGNEQHYTVTVWTHPPPQAAGTVYFARNVEDVLAAGSRPDRLAGGRSQERIQRRTQEQTADAPLLLTLDSPAPLMAGPLVEGPTILTPFIPMLQNVDTPVPCGGRGASGGLQGFLPGPSSSFTVEQIVDNQVPRGGGRRLQGFLPEQSATALTVEPNVDIPVPHEGLQDFRARQSSASSSHSPAGVADDAFEVFFSHFSPGFKKCDTTSALWVGSASELDPMDAGSS